MRNARFSPGATIRSVALLCSVLALSAIVSPALAYDEAEYLKAAERVLCDCGCHPQSVAACACGRAAELRDEMRTMVAGGMTGDEVIASYVAKHGEKILIAPDAEGFNLFAWLGPLAGLLLAVVAVILILRRWKGNPEEEPDTGTELDTTLDAGYLSRLNKDLEKMQ